MRITAITPMVLGTQWRNLVILKVETDEGLVGLGESRPINKVDAAIGYVRDVADRFVIGLDPFDIELLVKRLTVEDYGRPGEVAMTGLAMIEMACWDIIGKALNQPIYRLLGGAVRQRIKAYGNGWYTVERTPDEFAAAARRAVAKGYRALKFDPFGAGYYEAEHAEKRKMIGLVEAVRDAVGPEVELLIEMHGRFNPVTAIEMTRELAPFKPSWVEEPVPPANIPALKKVADAVAPLGV
ncbi:MAG: mandelate racemase/muconate lactonizing enzyme family protein, partial [Caldilinea sp.]